MKFLKRGCLRKIGIGLHLFRQAVDDVYQEPEQSQCVVAAHCAVRITVCIHFCSSIQFNYPSCRLIQQHCVHNIHLAVVSLLVSDAVVSVLSAEDSLVSDAEVVVVSVVSLVVTVVSVVTTGVLSL